MRQVEKRKRSTLGYPQWLTVRENNNPRKRAKTESEKGHFMDSKENKLLFGRGPNRVIETACFDTKVQ